MAAGLTDRKRERSVAETLSGLAAREGSAAHPYPRQYLVGGRLDPRNAADAVHLVAMLHAQRPGVLDLAAERLRDPVVRRWIDAAIAGFAAERAYMLRLVVAVGPLPGTPGQSGTEAAVVAQRNAVEMLARSDRAGCPLGASVGLLLDWPTVRSVLDSAAVKFGVPRPAAELPSPEDMVRLVATFAEEPRTQRAVCFGAEQLLVQHRALWDLLEARCSARG